MTSVQKEEYRKRGARRKHGETQSSILEFILENNESVREPDIRAHLMEKHNVKDQGGINKHLHELGKDGLIELVAPKKSQKKLQRHGLTNRWDIIKVENLKSIRENFTEFKLNNYKKSISIILEDQARKGYLLGINSTHAYELRVQLKLSASFFDLCLEKDIETLYDKAKEIYEQFEGHNYTQIIKNSTNELYTKCIAQISVSPEIWLNVYNTNISDLSKLDTLRDYLKSIPDIKISEDSFQNILENTHIWGREFFEWETKFMEEFAIEMSHTISQNRLNKSPLESEKEWEESLRKVSKYILKKLLEEVPVLQRDIPAEEWKFLYVKELSIRISSEIFQKVFREIPLELIITSDESENLNMWIEVFMEILKEVLKKTVEIPKEELNEIHEVTLHWYTRRNTIHRVMFECFYIEDIVHERVTSEEKEFMFKLQNLKTDSSIDRTNALNEFYKDYYEKIMNKKEAQ